MINCRKAFLAGKIPLIRIITCAVVPRPLNTMFCVSPALDLNLKTSSLHFTTRTKASYTVVESPERGILKKIFKKLGWYVMSQSKLKRSAYYLYEGIADGVDYSSFFREFKLEDTFFSWFLITELHVWMLLVRVMAEGEEGRYIRNNIVEALWADVEKRSKLLGASNPSALRTQRNELFEQFQAAIINYDEGILSDDKVLAGAVWRRFFNANCDNPEKVELLVKYIRKQVQLLEDVTRDELFGSPSIKWITMEPIQ